MKYLTLIAVAICATLISCKDDSHPIGAGHLTISNYGDYEWVMATEIATGNIIDVKQKSGNSVTLNTGAVGSDSVAVTFLKNYSGKIVLTTFGGVGRSGVFSAPDSVAIKSLPVTDIGSSQLTISNYTPNEYGMPVTFSNSFLAVSEYPSGSDVGISWELVQDYDSILVSGYRGTTPVYSWFSNVTANANLTNDFSGFLDFPNTINIKYDASEATLFSGATYGNLSTDYLGANGYVFSFFDGYTAVPPKLGYLDGFASYTTQASLSASFKTSYYSSRGATNPSEIDLSFYNFTKSDSSIAGFEFSYAGKYNYKVIKWMTVNQTVEWDIYSGAGAKVPSISKIPEEIIAAYPSLSLSDLQYTGADFYWNVDNSKYQIFNTVYFNPPTISAHAFYRYSFIGY